MITHSFWKIGSLVLLFVLTIPALSFINPPAGEAATPLFTPITLPDGLEFADDETIEQAQAVQIEGVQLGGVHGRTLSLNLFDDVQVTAVLDHIQHNDDGSLSWIGHVAGERYSQVNLVLKDSILVGAIVTPQGYYEIAYLSQGIHAVYKINQNLYPPELPPAEPIYTPEQLAAAAQAPQLDDGSIIDIMVVYTPNARNGAGGTTAMENTIIMAVDWTNVAYQNSQIVQQLNLVHMAEVTYTDSGSLSTDRNRLQNPSDGFMDEVHGWRDAYAADVVTLIVEDPGCGIAYIMNPVSPAFESFAFNVTKRSCAVGNYTFGHELGHLMSARHDWLVDPTNNAPFTYNHGYVHPGSQWRTVMAYSDGCGGCVRLGYFSNPNVLYNGDPMGVPEGQPQAADNHLTLNNTALTVANFRQSLGGTPTPTFTPTATNTPTITLTPTSSSTPTNTPTATTTSTATATATNSPTATATNTPTVTATTTPDPTAQPNERFVYLPVIVK